jgi:hypothetical protein
MFVSRATPHLLECLHLEQQACGDETEEVSAMADDDFTWIELSEDKLEQLARAELDMRASADELFNRFARPDET